MSTSSPLPFVRSRAAPLCLVGGLLAGTIDVVFAGAYWHASVPLTLRSIASWVLGPAAFHGGAAAAAVGAVLEAVLMVAMYAGYGLLARRHPALLRHPMRKGLVYGAALYALQFGVLVPLSPAPFAVLIDPLWHIACCSVYMLMVGIPAARIARLATVPSAAERFVEDARHRPV